MIRFPVTLFLLIVGVTMTSCYPNGAPELACPALDPTACHGGTTATGPPPYKLTISSTSYKPKQNVTVTLSGIGTAKFKGFLVEGRMQTGNMTDSVGYFYNTTTAKNVCSYSKLSENVGILHKRKVSISCQCCEFYPETGIGITQIDSHDRSSETFVWRAPDRVMGNLIFIYTIIRGTGDDPSDFWHGMRSPPMSPSSSSFTQVTIV